MTPASSSAATADATQEASLSARDFDRVAAKIFELAGIVIEPQKRQMIHARLARRLRATGLDTFSAYLDVVEAGKDAAELQAFINAITTNLTSFFRENHHFDHFRRSVLAPMQTRRAERLRVWSAGCSTGEEPYSIALTLLSALNTVPSDYKVLATDLDTGVLEKAKSGLYPKEKAGSALAAYGRYLGADDTGKMIQIGTEPRALITFRQLNLMQAWPMSGVFDVIFCRNVLIYFNPETKADLIDRFAEKLKPGGYLYLGHSESILGEHPKFENEGQTTYRRREG